MGYSRLSKAISLHVSSEASKAKQNTQSVSDQMQDSKLLYLLFA